MSLRRQALTAALAIFIASAVALLAWGRRPRWTTVLDAGSLPWSALLLDGTSLGEQQRPDAVLYVLPSCRHCDSAAVVFAAETRRTGIRGLVISASGSAEAEEYRRKLNLPGIATDSSQSFAQAAGIRVVPTLGRAVSQGRIALSPIPRPALVPRYLQAAP